MSHAFEGHDCLDIGADTNSLGWVRSYLGARTPLGLNIEPQRLENMRAAGEACVDMNALDIPEGVTFDFVSMSHFVEHLQNREQLLTMLGKALRMARRAVWISGPYFEADDHIREHGVKFVWGDWTGHDSRFTLRTFLDWLEEQAPGRITISLGFGATDSSPDNIVALGERPNVDSYERDRTVEKPVVTFDRPAAQEFLVLVTLDPAFDAQRAHLGRHGVPGVAPAAFRASPGNLLARDPAAPALRSAATLERLEARLGRIEAAQAEATGTLRLLERGLQRALAAWLWVRRGRKA